MSGSLEKAKANIGDMWDSGIVKSDLLNMMDHLFRVTAGIFRKLNYGMKKAVKASGVMLNGLSQV
ncbi:MAG: hypothetical protein QW291_09535 [Thermofilaceae archaeon]